MEHVRLYPNHAAFVEEHVARGDYATPDDYVAALIDAAARAEAQDRLETLLLEGLEGEATEWTDADAERLRRLATNGR